MGPGRDKVRGEDVWSNFVPFYTITDHQLGLCPVNSKSNYGTAGSHEVYYNNQILTPKFTNGKFSSILVYYLLAGRIYSSCDV